MRFPNLFTGTGDNDELGKRGSGHGLMKGQGINSLKQANSNTSASEILKYLTGRNFMAVIEPISPPVTTAMIQYVK